MRQAANGAEIVHNPVIQPYGMKEFAVRDPAGYVLGFGEAVSIVDRPNASSE